MMNLNFEIYVGQLTQSVLSRCSRNSRVQKEDAVGSENPSDFSKVAFQDHFCRFPFQKLSQEKLDILKKK